MIQAERVVRPKMGGAATGRRVRFIGDLEKTISLDLPERA